MNHQLRHAIEVSRLLGIPDDWLLAEVAAGRLPALDADGIVVFNLSKVIDCLQDRAARGQAIPASKGRVRSTKIAELRAQSKTARKTAQKCVAKLSQQSSKEDSLS